MGYFDFDFPHTHFYNSDLREILKYVEKLVKAVTEIDGWVETHQTEYEELKKLYDDLVSGNFPDSFIDSVRAWLSVHAVDIIAEEIKTVHFGLTNDGYFCAYIPSSWSEVQFDTITNYDDPLYGHLILKYD